MASSCGLMGWTPLNETVFLWMLVLLPGIIGCWTKYRGIKNPKMDGENNGKPYEQMITNWWFGGFHPYFWKHPYWTIKNEDVLYVQLLLPVEMIQSIFHVKWFVEIGSLKCFASFRKFSIRWWNLPRCLTKERLSIRVSTSYFCQKGCSHVLLKPTIP